MTLIENGWVGLCAFIGIFLAGLLAALRVCLMTRDPELRNLGACLVSGLLIGLVGAATFDLLSFSVATGLTFLFIGLCGALLRIAREEERAAGIPTEEEMSLAARVIARLRPRVMGRAALGGSALGESGVGAPAARGAAS